MGCCASEPSSPARADLVGKPAGDFSLEGLTCQAQVVDIYDGDTVRVQIASRDVFRGGPPPRLQFRARLAGIDSPELRPPLAAPGREAEVAAAKAARQALETKLAGRPVAAEFGKFDKYGRVLVTFRADGENLNEWMVASGHAVSYDGGRKGQNQFV